ncbi:hypothetical protein [Sulfurivirga sp.]|uniref:hypothetical protein n=1 Tax=Sulfurivirga sp. TaxID=2614236 RepID=UPI0025E76D35|nr:hypothetical protein [Sulfurivirga sp.]
MSDQDCFYQVLGLSSQLMEAVEADEWERVSELQQRWMHDMRQCVERLMDAGSGEEVEMQLARLLEDVAQKTARLEQVIETLRQQQQQDLRQLQQTAAYLQQP